MVDSDDALGGARKRNDFLDKIIALDGDRGRSTERYGGSSRSYRDLLNNMYVFQPFWDYHNGLPEVTNPGNLLFERELNIGTRITHG